jgi:hypothetical protein
MIMDKFKGQFYSQYDMTEADQSEINNMYPETIIGEYGSLVS